MADAKLRILIVEDDAVLRRGLARMFPRDRFEVIQLGDGRAAVDSILSSAPDLALCDYRLPGLDGLGVLSCLRKANPRTPFILLTAFYSERLEQQAMELGASVVLEKPVELTRLKRECEGFCKPSELT